MSSSVLAMLRKLMAREAPAQTEPVREALRRSARTGREHAVVGASDKPVGGSVVEGDKYTVMPSSADRSAALMSGSPVLDVHTHPVGALGVRPSPEDFAYYRDKYGAQVRSGPVARELRSLIVQPPERGPRASAAYNFFATDKPLAVFDPRRIEDARYELQRGAARGKFSSIMDDPAFRDYFEYGGDIGDLMEDAASLMLLRRRAEQGLGRHELQLGNRLITPDTRATERRLFEMMTPEALELLRAKKMATGGAVKSGDEMSEEEYLARLQQLRPRSGRRAEELNQSRGVNMPLQLARGWAAGTAGLPGDVESLLRMVPLPTRGGLSRAAEKTVLPTSEEILPRIPGEDTSPAGRFFSGAGTLAGGAGVTKIARGVNRAADVAGNKMVQAITGNPQATAVGVLQEAAQMSPLAAIVKPKGGNWASGSVEGMIDKLKTTDSNMMQLLRNGDPRFVDQALLSRLETNSATIDNWLETKLSKYVKNEMATPEDPLRLQADEFAGRKAKLLAEKDKQLEKATADLERAQAERGVPPEVLTRSQARIRELRRERDYIEAQRGLHFEPPGDQARRAKVKREQAGMPTEPTAGTDVGTAWENTADAVTMTAPYRDLVNMYDGRAMPDKLRELGGEFAVKNPGARAHQIDSGASPSDLGLYHMTDELMNALDPASGLPEKLMLTPDKLQKMSVAQVAKRVDDINAWRAVQTKEANAARAANAATSVVKEYPDEGLRWVELKLPDTQNAALPEGWQIQHEKLPNAGDFYYVVDDKGNPFPGKGLVGETPEEAQQNAHRALNRGALEDALKYEGEMLSHCVGGYCDRVLSGKSRIMSLRDAEGRPRVTVELQPARQSKHPLYSQYMDEVVKPGGEYAEQYIDKTLRRHPRGDYTQETVLSDKIESDFPKWLESTHPERLAELKSLPPPVIQIKTKSNKLAAEEDIPYVLDFLNSQPFDYVNDLPRGIIDIKEYSGSLADTAQELFNKRFLTKQEMDKARRLDKKRTQQTPGFAGGGLVRFDPDEIQHLAGKFTDQFTPGYAAGGLVKYDPAEIDTIVSEMKEAFHG